MKKIGSVLALLITLALIVPGTWAYITPVNADGDREIVVVTVYKDVEVVREVIKEVPATPRYPVSLEELEAFLDKNTLGVILRADSNGFVSLSNPNFDCDDYATELEARAMRAGLLITAVPVWNGRIWTKQVSPYWSFHVGNWTKIDNVYYYIEPQDTSANWKIVEIMKAD